MADKSSTSAADVMAVPTREMTAPAQSGPAPAGEERLDEVSADLPYELQSKIFEQTAAGALAGAGLSVTLIGSLLKDAPPTIWGSVACFAAAAYAAGAGNTALVEGLFKRQPTLKASKRYQKLAAMLMGMAIGIDRKSVV